MTVEIASSVPQNQPRQIRGIFPYATVGAKTNRGGVVVTASSQIHIGGLAVAIVGDTVRYPDGTEAQISSGAGAGDIVNGRIVAIVASHIDNGDYICWTPDASMGIAEYIDNPTDGFLVEGWQYSAPTTSMQKA